MDTKRKIQLERLFYLEFLAYFTGQVSRKDLVARFGVSEQAVTKDIALYAEEFAPDLLTYNVREKTYIFSGAKTYFEHDVDQSLFTLSGKSAISVDVKHEERLSNWVNTSIKRKQSLDIVSTITRSIYQKFKIEANYYSIQSGNKNRLLTPLAILNDGLRWHIRCFDHNDSDGKFKDYNLERFTNVVRGEKSNVTLADDKEWNNEVIVKLIPHPEAEHPETILKDYAITANKNIEVKLKICSVGYFLKQWKVDCTNNAEMNPKSHQLYLSNKAELIKNGVSTWAVGGA